MSHSAPPTPVASGPASGRILVVRGGALGDFILTLPVLAALRSHFPGNRIEVLGYPQWASLAVETGLADDARSIEARPLAGFFARGGSLDSDLSGYFRSFHLIVSFLFDPDLIFRTNVGLASQAGFIQGPHRPDETLPLHACDQLLRPLQQLAVFDADAVPRLRRARNGAAPDGVRRIAVHPGSGSERKNWPEAAWAELLRRLSQDPGLRFLLVGADAEGDRLERLAAALPPDHSEVLRARPLPEVANRLAGCTGFLGHDSGITHLAAAIGLPGIVLWGPSRLPVWRPRSDRMDILESGGDLATLLPGTVEAAIRGKIGSW
ncbi:MAG: glycosyltransferase family 9 protein [Verrucomicrobiales bacterium]|nr:glycosyltransferase family 9 protein [Verrucomicrobiales bacterium]